MAENDQGYDFIVVGAGPAGCAAASDLARSDGHPRVLLLEAGDSNRDVSFRQHSNMLVQMRTESLNWEHKTVDLPHLYGRQINLNRGKGLGGCSAINATFWFRGSRDEWDEISELVGDDDWQWNSVRERFKRLENYHHEIEPRSGEKRYYDPGEGAYGTAGRINISSPVTNWSRDMAETADTWAACGYKINPDGSDGDHVGIAMAPLSGYGGIRSTSADLLENAPENLHVRTKSWVYRVQFEDGQAKAVTLSDGEIITAAKEIILCAGSVDSPKILLHSGIGPAAQLSSLGIPIVYANKNVGQDLGDHYHMFCFFTNRDDSMCRAGAPNGGNIMGFLKSEAALRSPEFEALPKIIQRRLQKPTVATFEIAHFGASDRTHPSIHGRSSILVIELLSSQGKGEVTLASADPAVPPLVRPGYLEHPWDKRVAIEATREAMRVMDHASSPKSKVPGTTHVCPKSDSEEDILDYWRRSLISTWHLTGTCKIGKSESADRAVIDPEFKVYGVNGLRVADMSVVPLVPSSHPQTMAYQIGMMVASKLIKEYGLNN
ncbi:hypothetical protein V8C37DRAFT_398032 [Trichoderma ceciliae]